MNVLILLLLFGLPLLVVPNSISYFEIPKVFAAEALIVVLAILTFYHQGFSPKKYNRKGLLALLVIFTLSLLQILIFRQLEMFWGNQFRLQGIFLLWCLLVFSLVSSRIEPKTSWGNYAALSLIGLTASCFLFGANQAGRIVGSLGEPNSLATTAIFLWVFITGLKKPFFTSLGCIVAILIVFVTGSRSGLISLAIVGLFLGLARVKLLTISRCFQICLILVLISYSGPFIQQQTVFENRPEIWSTGLVAGIHAPIFGNGFGNVTQALNQTSWQIQNNVRFQFIDSSHNLFLEYFVEGGLIGLGSLIVLISLSIRSGIKGKSSTLLAAWLTILVMFSFNPLSAVNLVELWWLIGQGLRVD